MTERTDSGEGTTGRGGGPAYGRWVRRVGTYALAVLVAVQFLPTAAAHGGDGAPLAPQWYALVPLLGGVGLVAAAVHRHRSKRPVEPATVLAWGFLGVALAAVGAVGLVQLSPVETLAARRTIDRSWYRPLALLAGVGTALASLLLGRLRWPTRPRYTGLGILLGLWIAYPAIAPGDALTSPAGYALALAVPLATGYVLWRDCRTTLSRLFADRHVRWFGVGIGVVSGLFFMFSMGMLTFVPETGSGVPWSDGFVTTLPVANPLVYWPAVEFFFPSVPLSGVVSVGMTLLVGLMAVLIGLNGMVIAARVRRGGGSEAVEGAAGSAAIAAPNACCCCGPVVSEVAVVALGPSAATPLYWLFVDVASPVGSLFFVASVAVLTGNLVRSADE